MSKELFASLPNEVLNLIWTHISPLVKYSLNKENFNKYYNCRYYNIHSSQIIYFNNYNYYYYLLKHDLLIFSEIVLKMYIEKLISGELVIKKYNNIYYKNINFYSLIDFFYYYSNNSNNSNNSKSKDFITQIIRKYNLTHLIKKIHKNNVNKNIRWNI
jgi:hypothetical protein